MAAPMIDGAANSDSVVLGCLDMTALGEEASSDAELVRTIAALGGAGDARAKGVEKAEAELCRRFAPRIRLYGLRHLRSEDRARDLVQAVLLAVLVAARASRIEDPERLDRFVLGTCRHASMRIRDLDARAMLVGDEELDVTPFLQETEFVDTGSLVGCIAALDLRGRVVVMMSFLEERSADEIAKALETTAGNVRVVRHRAIGALRRCLDGAGKTDVNADSASRETSR
jgi:RNA polymerase sigma-70 factor (ECF subfamily)